MVKKVYDTTRKKVFDTTNRNRDRNVVDITQRKKENIVVENEENSQNSENSETLEETTETTNKGVLDALGEIEDDFEEQEDEDEDYEDEDYEDDNNNYTNSYTSNTTDNFSSDLSIAPFLAGLFGIGIGIVLFIGFLVINEVKNSLQSTAFNSTLVEPNVFAHTITNFPFIFFASFGAIILYQFFKTISRI